MKESFLYLLLASASQIGWLYNIKLLRKDRFRGFKLEMLISFNGLKLIVPVILYIILGIGNIIFLTWTMKSLPASVTYAIWTGMVIAASSIIDGFIAGRKFNFIRLFFIFIIGVGIVGLRLSYDLISAQ